MVSSYGNGENAAILNARSRVINISMAIEVAYLWISGAFVAAQLAEGCYGEKETSTRSSKPGRSHGNVVQFNKTSPGENYGENADSDFTTKLSIDTALEVDC